MSARSLGPSTTLLADPEDGCPIPRLLLFATLRRKLSLSGILLGVPTSQVVHFVASLLRSCCVLGSNPVI
jgi:hypothetical protein